MTNCPHGVKLSEGQRMKLAKAYNNNSARTIRLANNELSGSHAMINVDKNSDQ